MAFTKDVVEHHLKSFDAGDLQGVLSDYAAGALLFTVDGPLKGPEAMRPLYQKLIAEFAKPGAKFTLKQQLFYDEVGYIVWAAETADNVYEIATDTFVVRDGKIVAQTFAAKITPKSGGAAKDRVH